MPRKARRGSAGGSRSKAANKRGTLASVPLLIAGVGAAAVLAVGLLWQQGGAGLPPIDPADAGQVARGEALYAENCASCHGADLEGERAWRRRKPDGTLRAPPHDATGHTWHHPDDLLFAVTKHGGAYVAQGDMKSNMPAFEETLSDADIAAVLAFIKSRWPQEIRARQARLNQ